jgi:hypothetical protein
MLEEKLDKRGSQTDGRGRRCHLGATPMKACALGLDLGRAGMSVTVKRQTKNGEKR